MSQPRFQNGAHAAFIEGGWYAASDLPGALKNCWFPIETAPKDGTEIWLFDPEAYAGGPYMQKGSFGYGRWRMIDEQTGGTCHVEPTHWMPLPEPPQVVSSASEDD